MPAFLTTPSAVRRRRAFFGAMAPLFGREAALEAINIWEHTFGSDQPLLRGISQYATLVIQELGWKISPADLSIILLQHLQQNEDSLPPDPLPQLTGRKQTESPQRATAGSALTGDGVGAVLANTSPLTRTLSVLLVKLCDAAGQADARMQQALLKQFLTTCAGQQSRETAADVAALLAGRSPSLVHPIKKPDAIALVNLFYVSLAELYGPVSADRILTSSVRGTEETAEGRALSPRDLL
jgi:hypothetical protein